MRVTNKMIANTVLTNLNADLKRLQKQQDQMSTGHVVSKPSDDPVIGARVMTLDSVLKQHDQYDKNMDDALGWMQTSETALGNLTDALQRVRELTVYGANGTLSQTDREALAKEVEQLTGNVVQIANTSYANRYVFAGTKTTTSPFDANGNYKGCSTVPVVNEPVGTGDGTTTVFNLAQKPVTSSPPPSLTVGGAAYTLVPSPPSTMPSDSQYSIDYNTGKITFGVAPAAGQPIVANYSYYDSSTEGKLDWEVSQGVQMTVNIGGINAFVNSDVFNILNDIQSNLTAGNTDNLSNTMLSKLDNAIDNTLNLRAALGAKSNRLEMAQNQSSSESIDYEQLLSKLNDVDMAKIYTDFNMQETVYQSALNTGARIVQQSLLDFLR
ncbi:MAG: Flagellar hook-associated protein 3 [Pelotomaculum sp. PtaU1.Bin035]|nr:MAG: Flagellar hook-associated protein 3 [Pelotomaculum sp. PtaU1.Bin035]